MSLHKLKIGDRVHTPDGTGTIMFFEQGDRRTVGVDSDHAGLNYTLTYFDDDDDNISTINKYSYTKVMKIPNTIKLMKE